MAETPPPSTGILTLLNESLAFEPERSDLWMTRFDVLQSMGFKREFQQAVTDALGTPKIRRELDWASVRRMWLQIAPDERFPGDAEGLPAATAEPARRERVRRFNDIAMEVAGPQLSALARDWTAASARRGFLEEFSQRAGVLLQRPTALELSAALSKHAGEGHRIFLKREDRRAVPAEAEHAAAQCYVATQLGKRAVVTGSDVEAHALGTARAARHFGLACTVIVRPADFDSRHEFIAQLETLGVDVVAVPEAGLISRDPREGAVRVWQQHLGRMQLVLSLGMAPAPYTAIANAFQSVLGREAEAQYQEQAGPQNQPRTVIAAVGSESDAIGFVLPFLGRKEIRIAMAEPAPGGTQHWRASQRLRAYHGQVREHSWLRGVGRIRHVAIGDAGAEAYRTYLSGEGIEASLEDARAVALALMLARNDPAPQDFMVLLG